LLGNGDGTFQAPVNYGAQEYPSSIAVGDFNTDGKLDLVVANELSMGPNNYTNGSVSVLLGNGDGTFRSAVNYGAGVSPDSVAVGDVNGDGKLDLVVANQGSANVSMLLGNGDGTFQAAVNYSTGEYPFSVALGDLNGDGQPDLAVGNSANVSVLLNTCVSAGIDLAIARSNSTTAVVSWPLPSTGFILESTTNLTSTNWQRAVEVPATNNARLEITTPAIQEERYFRLHKP